MKKIACFIIDDEPIARSIIRNYVGRTGDLEVIGEFKNPEEAREAIADSPVEVLFLDIRMPRIMGTDFLRSLAQPPLVVFTTAYSEYATEGFDLNAVDYLMKPITYERFLQASQKIKERLSFQPTPIHEADATFIFIKQDTRLVKLELDELLYVEAERDFCSLYLASGKRLLASMQLRQLESMLPATKFVRVHRSFIVHLSKIKTIKGNLIQIANTEIPIGASFREQLFRQLKIR